MLCDLFWEKDEDVFWMYMCATQCVCVCVPPCRQIQAGSLIRETEWSTLTQNRRRGIKERLLFLYPCWKHYTVYVYVSHCLLVLLCTWPRVHLCVDFYPPVQSSPSHFFFVPISFHCLAARSYEYMDARVFLCTCLCVRPRAHSSGVTQWVWSPQKAAATVGMVTAEMLWDTAAMVSRHAKQGGKNRCCISTLASSFCVYVHAFEGVPFPHYCPHWLPSHTSLC